jgi:NitT/TauT family transport system ATP-binding protein
MTSGSTVTLDGVGKSYDQRDSGRLVVSNVSLEIHPGELLAICGRSGVGKSTLLRLIAGLDTPSSGQITINGDIVTAPPREVGYVVQDYSSSLFPWMRVHSNLRIAMSALPGTKLDKDTAIAESLAAVGLDAYARHYPWQLSGGMQQRVALARALVVKPRLLLMDEPFASVDAHTRLELEDLTLRLVKERSITTILVTHDIDEALYMADKVVVLSQNPATFTHTIHVPFGKKRQQETTRSSPEFHQRRHLLIEAMAPQNWS